AEKGGQLVELLALPDVVGVVVTLSALDANAEENAGRVGRAFDSSVFARVGQQEGILSAFMVALLDPPIRREQIARDGGPGTVGLELLSEPKFQGDGAR